MPPRSPPRFQLRARLGMGGMGDVFLAEMTHPGPPRLVALKRIRADRRFDPVLVEDFHREVRISAALRHPNIVGVEAFGEDEHGLFLAMEYVDGRSASELSRRIQATRELLPMEAGWIVLCDVARALAHAHGSTGFEGVVHRDVTADNVLLSYEGDAKLSDFGIARISGGTPHTAAGQIKGKYSYLAPELLRGTPASVTTDLYSLGVLAHRLFTGQAPFNGANDAEIVQAILFATPPRLGTLRPDLPPRVAQLFDSCISKDPAARPPSAQALLEALEKDADPIAHRAVLARAMERTFPREGDDLRTEITRAIAVGHTHTLSAHGAHPPERAKKMRVWAAVALACAVGAGAGAATMLGRVSQPESDGGTSPALNDDTAAVDLDGDRHDPVEPLVAPVRVVPERTTSAPAAESEEPTRVPAATVKAPSEEGARKIRTRRAPAAMQQSRVKPSSKRSEQPAHLQILVYPWAQVFIDGVLVGVSPPLPPQKVSAGTHSIILANPELNVRRHLQVVAKPGVVTPIKVVLTE